MSDLPFLPSLTKLTCKHNHVNLDPAGETALTKLQALDLNGCKFSPESRGLSALASLTRLEATLGLDWVNRYVLVTSVGPLQQLRHLRICSDFKQAHPISSFSVLATLQHLTHLALTGPTLPAGALAAVFKSDQAGAVVACFPKLQHLSITSEDRIWEWQDWQAPGARISCEELRQLAWGCPQLQSLALAEHRVEAAGLSCLSYLSGFSGLTVVGVNTGE